jgi:hypothetical protein
MVILCAASIKTSYRVQKLYPISSWLELQFRFGMPGLDVQIAVTCEKTTDMKECYIPCIPSE